MKSSFRAVRGELPKKVDIADWSSEKILSFLKFAYLSLNDKGSYTWDKEFEEKIISMIKTEPLFEEFLVRIKVKEMTYFGLVGRLSNAVRIVLAYVKSNPHVVTPEMEDIMRKTPRFSWALVNYVPFETKIGQDIVMVENRDTTTPGAVNPEPKTTNLTLPEIHYNQALLAGAAVVKDLLKGIKKKDILEMPTKDRVKLGLLGMQLLSKSLNQGKPKSVVFKQLTINSAGKDDLEKAMLDYAQTQD